MQFLKRVLSLMFDTKPTPYASKRAERRREAKRLAKEFFTQSRLGNL